jgi:3-hydroxyacyl-CoA dehydrogenase
MANKGQTAIIGSGLIGTSWAVVRKYFLSLFWNTLFISTSFLFFSQIFSKAGYEVVMYDSDEAALGRAKDRAQAQTSALAAQDLLPADVQVDEILGRISYTSSLKDAIQNAFYIQVRL